MQLQQYRASAHGLSGANRPIRLRLFVKGQVVDDLLLVKHVNGGDAICGGMAYRLSCVAEKAGLPLKDFNGIPAELQFVTDRGELRAISGLVAQVAEGESDGGLATYQLVICDVLTLMEKRVRTRIFRNASEVDITNSILRKAG